MFENAHVPDTEPKIREFTPYIGYGKFPDGWFFIARETYEKSWFGNDFISEYLWPDGTWHSSMIEKYYNCDENGVPIPSEIPVLHGYFESRESAEKFLEGWSK